MPKEDNKEVAQPTTLDDVLADETAKIEEEDNGDTAAEDTTETSDTSEPDAATDDGADDEATDTQVDEEPYIEETPPVLQDLPSDVATYVNEKLPDVEVWGRDGEGGKVEKFTVKSAFDLPDNFIPRSYKDQQIQGQQFAKQDRLTANLETEYADTQENNRKAEEQAQLEASWAVELKGAQASGRIPKVVKEVPGDAGFDKAAEVIEYMKTANEQLAKINAPYRVQSFTQALDLYEADALKTSKVEETNAEDALKSKKGSMIGSGRGTKDQYSKLPTAGTKLEDVLAEFAT